MPAARGRRLAKCDFEGEIGEQVNLLLGRFSEVVDLGLESAAGHVFFAAIDSLGDQLAELIREWLFGFDEMRPKSVSDVDVDAMQCRHCPMLGCRQLPLAHGDAL